MRLFNLFRSSSAPIARERLQILLAHERMPRLAQVDANLVRSASLQAAFDERVFAAG